MKIALLYFPISKTGGIDTWLTNLRKGFDAIGVQHKTFDLKLNSNDFFGFRNKQDYQRIINEYDAAIFVHACPHLNKTYDSMKWLECYDITTKRIAVFHDAMAKYQYAWVGKAPIDVAVAVQDRCLISIDEMGGRCKTALIRHPVDLSEMGMYSERKKDQALMANQFKSWKNNDVVIKAIPDMNLTTHVFNAGTEMFYMRRAGYPFEDFHDKGFEGISKATKLLRDAINNGGVPRGPDMIFVKYHKYGDIWKKAVDSGKFVYHGIGRSYGLAPRSELIDCFKDSKAVIDMSSVEHHARLGNDKRMSGINYAVLEGISMGCVPIVTKWALQKPWGWDNFVVTHGMSEDLVLCVNALDYDAWKIKLITNQNILKQNYDCTEIASQFKSVVDNTYDNYVKNNQVSMEKWF